MNKNIALCPPPPTPISCITIISPSSHGCHPCPFLEVIKKHNPKAFIWANVYTDTMFLRAFFVFSWSYVITRAHNGIRTSTKGCGVQLQHSQHNSNNSLCEVCNLAQSYFFLGEAKTSTVLTQSCWHTTILLYVAHVHMSRVRHPPSSGDSEQPIFLGQGNAHIHSAVSLEQHFNIPPSFQQT
jgi:hypothetical protein